LLKKKITKKWRPRPKNEEKDKKNMSKIKEFTDLQNQ
jgi:hypothetical protein